MQTSVQMLMKKARVLLVPSLWYEGLPMVVPEAFGASLPIVASRIGSLETLIMDQHNGLLVEPGCASALRAAVRRIAADRHFENCFVTVPGQPTKPFIVPRPTCALWYRFTIRQ